MSAKTAEMAKEESCNAGLESSEMAIRSGGELIKGAVLDDLALVHHDDPIALHNCRHTMRDHNRCTSLHGSVESLLNDLLALLIKSRSCLVKDENLGVLDESSSDGHSLLLSS